MSQMGTQRSKDHGQKPNQEPGNSYYSVLIYCCEQELPQCPSIAISYRFFKRNQKFRVLRCALYILKSRQPIQIFLKHCDSQTKQICMSVYVNWFLTSDLDISHITPIPTFQAKKARLEKVKGPKPQSIQQGSQQIQTALLTHLTLSYIYLLLSSTGSYIGITYTFLLLHT